MKTSLYTIILIFFIGYAGFSQCVISELNVIPTECNISGKFFVEINFDHTGTSLKFRVVGNGTNYGLFEYADLPITLGPLDANCTTNYEFVVRDAEIESCLAFKNIGTKCCDDLCDIEFKNVEIGECHDGKYALRFDLNHENTPANGFDLFNNGQFYGYYQYSQLPLKLENFPSSSTETFNKIVVCANDNDSCCDTLTLVNPCICSIYRVQAQVIECNEDTETFSIRLNFKHKLNADSFRIGGNSVNYGTYAYKDLPITIKNLHFSPVTEYEFLIVDVEDAFCFATYDLGIVTECNFDCSIYDVIAEPYECSDGKFYVDVAFKYKNTSLEGFIIRGNGQIYGSFEYGEPHYKIGPLNGDCTTEYEFVVKDKELEGCAAPPVFLGPICCEQHCSISDLTIIEHCVNNDLVAFDINFNHSNTTGSFVLRINNSLVGTFLYADLPIKITNTNYAPTAVFKIFDAENEMCNLIKEYTFHCVKEMDCKLYDLVVKATDCNDDGKFYAILKFLLANHGNHGFIVKVNGVIWDTLEYGKESYEIGPLNGDCTTIYHFLIQDVAHPDCADDFAFSEKICCNKECKLYDLTVKATDCNDDGKFYAILKFFSANHGNHGFMVKVNGVIWDTLEYGKESYEIGPLNGDCTTIYQFLIQDVAHPDCADEFAFSEKICCSHECKLHSPVVSFSACIQQKFNLTLNFEHISTTQKFRIKINGVIKGPFLYTDLPIVIENLETKKPYEIIIWDTEKESCRIVVAIPAIECSSATDEVANKAIMLINDNQTIEIKLDNLWIPGNTKLMDMSGKVIASINNLPINQLDISRLPAGMYLLHFTNKQYNYTKKIMKF